MIGVKTAHDCIKQFRDGLHDDLRKVDIPTVAIQGADDRSSPSTTSDGSPPRSFRAQN